MKRHSRFLSILLLLVIISTTLIGCGGATSKKEIIGKWRVARLSETESSDDNMLNGMSIMVMAMLFSEGSTIEFINEKKVSIGFTIVEYKWLSDNKLQLGSDNGEGAMVFDVDIKGNKMTLSNVVVIELEKVGD
jgi:trans-aconitate methyltransferase